MPTNFSFATCVDIADIPDPTKSVGSHVAAKLQTFGSDERTLTDELCDMLCIWLHALDKGGAGEVKLDLGKTTTAQEVKWGADLELTISRDGNMRKRCMIQAKAIDPGTNKLRCDNASGWKKLRRQLFLCRKEAGELAFLLVYVPGALLDGATYSHVTYEQDYLTTGGGVHGAFFGATMIPVDVLLKANHQWRYAKKVPHTSGRVFGGVPFWVFLLELIACRRGKWTSAADAKVGGLRARATVTVNMNPQREIVWERIEADCAEHLPVAEAPQQAPELAKARTSKKRR